MKTLYHVVCQILYLTTHKFQLLLSLGLHHLWTYIKKYIMQYARGYICILLFNNMIIITINLYTEVNVRYV